MSSKSSFYNSTGVTNTQSNAIDASVDNAEASAVASENSANSASASASTATTKASEASTSASTATTKASEASTSASTATTKASEASTSATTATTKATESANSATASANSATAASTSSSTATTKASEASSSASTALSHKNDAQTAKTAAETAETNAETAETNAASSATAASTSASSASTSATTATTKAGEAATSASTATTKANEAATSASNANTAASTATTKASEASTSANNAASSATAASASKDAALAALDSFDDRYLGVKSSNPTVDNDGNALVAGSLYFNSTDDTMKVYEGSAWVAAYASLSGAVLQTGSAMTGDLSFGDNDKAIFGASSDLQIYHNGSNNHAFIKETGSGNLYVQANNLRLQSVSGGNYAQGVDGDTFIIYFNDNEALRTTSTGIQVTGTVVAHKVEIGNGSASGTSEILFSDNASGRGKILYDHSSNPETMLLQTTGTTAISIDNSQNVSIPNGNLGVTGDYVNSGHLLHNNNSGLKIIGGGNATNAGSNLTLYGGSNASAGTFRFRNGTATHLDVAGNGDISFYEDTGTTAKFFWDASAERLGLGTSSPSTALEIVGGVKLSADLNVGGNTLVNQASTDNRYLKVNSSSSGDGGILLQRANANKWQIASNTSHHLVLDSLGGGNVLIPTGSVGIGTSSPSYKADILSTNQYALRLNTTDANGCFLAIQTNGTAKGYLGSSHHLVSGTPSEDDITLRAENNLQFTTGGGSERMRIDSSGNVGIGTSTFGATYDKLAVAGGINIQDDYGAKLEIGRYTSGVPNSYIKLGANSNSLRFTNKNDSADLLTIENEGNVGIGTSSPSFDLDILDTSTASNTGAGVSIAHTTQPQLRFAQTTGNYRMYLGMRTNDLIISNDSGTEKIRFKQNGNVGIGVVPEYQFDVLKTTGNLAKFTTQDDNNGATNPLLTNYNASLRVDNAYSGAAPSANGTKVAKIQLSTVTANGYGAHGAIILDAQSNGHDSGEMSFATGSNSSNLMTERMRIDASGNVLVGKTTGAFATAGTKITSTGNVEITAASDGSLALGRTGSDGYIQRFYKDSALVGSIGSNGSYPYIGSHGASGKGIKITDALLPATNAGAFNDADVNLGASNVRWKDAYLSGNVLVGTTSTSTPTGGLAFRNSSNIGSFSIGHASGTGSGNNYGSFKYNGTSIGSITQSGTTGVSYNTSSDYRLKENVVDLTGASARVNQLDVKRFNFIADDTNTAVDGFLAHEVATVVPEAITGTKDAMRDEEYEVTPAVLDEDGNVTTAAVMGTRSVPDYQGIDQSKLVPLLTAALQEALTKIDAMETRLTALEG